MKAAVPLVVLLGLAAPSAGWAQSVRIMNGASENVAGGAQIVVNPAGIEVQSGGTFSMIGTSTSVEARFLGPAAGVPITVLSGGTVHFKFARLENLTTLSLAAGAKLLRAHDTAFVDLAGLNPGTAPWIDVSAMGTSDRDNLAFSLNRVTFSDPQGVPTRKNVKAGANTPLLRMLGNTTSHGNRWGETHNDDPAAKVLWHTGAVLRSGGSTFDTLEDAVKAAGTTSSSTLTMTLGANAFVDDLIDFNMAPSADINGPVVHKACLATLSTMTTVMSVLDGDFDMNRRGKLVNCVVARGWISEVTAENCTFFDPSAGTISVGLVVGTNLLIESGFTNSFSTFTTSREDAVANFFVNAAAYDFHLSMLGASMAVDEGTTLTTAVDFDNDARGYDGKPGGSGAWDIGADELILSSIVSITSTKPNGTWGELEVIPITITFSKPVTLSSGFLTVFLDSWAAINIPSQGPVSQITFNYTVGPDEASLDLTVTDLLLQTGASLIDSDGNPPLLDIPTGQNLGDLKNLVIDTWAPAVARITSSTPDGTYFIGHAINLRIEFTRPVVLTGGNLVVPLNSGATVNIPPFALTSIVNGTYTVASGNVAADLTVNSLSLGAGASLKSSTGESAFLSIPEEHNLADYKNIAVVSSPASPPAPPSNVRTTAYYNAVDVEWDASPSWSVDGYNVYRRLASGSWPPSPTPLNGNTLIISLKYRDTTAVNGTAYVYRVAAVGN